MDLCSTVPTDAPASIGVKRKKLRGEMQVTDVEVVDFRYATDAQPVPRMTTRGEGVVEGGGGEVGRRSVTRSRSLRPRKIGVGSGLWGMERPFARRWVEKGRGERGERGERKGVVGAREVRRRRGRRRSMLYKVE